MDAEIRTGAPTDLAGGMPATSGSDTAPGLDEAEQAALAAVAGHLIPAAHDMPSASDVVTRERVVFVLRARPDLLEPLKAALRPELGTDVAARLEKLTTEPTNMSALQLVIVSGYYTDKRVRELIGYPGQMAIEVKSWLYPAYLEEGLIDQMLARGPVWRDPETGKRALATDAPRTYAERSWGSETPTPEGGNDGRDSAR